MTLEEDMTYKGSLNLVDGILDLNGHTLTVEKNFIQHSGTLKINGGKLIVGSFTEMAEITGEPGNVIVMENDKDTIIVENKFEMQYSAFPEISKGEIIIKGDLNINTNNIKDGIQRLPGNVTFVIAGDKPQKLYDQNVILPNIRFENTDVATLSEVMVAGKVTDETDKTGGRITGNLLIDHLSQLEDGFFGGSIKLQENSVLNGNVTVKGSLSVGKNAGINLNGYSLTAGGMVLDYGSRFIMNKKSDRLTVNGDLTVYGVDIYDTGKRVFTNGQIEVYGNLTSKAIYGFTASGGHEVIVSSKNPDGSIEKRQIDFDSNNTSKAKLKKLILRGIEEDFAFNISKEKVAEEIIYDYTIRDYLAVEGLHAEDVTESTVTLKFTDSNSVSGEGKTVGTVDYNNANTDSITNDNSDEPEYYNEYKFKIFRDGIPVAVTKDTTFTDKNLTPETSYEYSVIVFDRYGNTSPSSESIKVTTTEDTLSVAVLIITVSVFISTSIEVI
ncbi:MAG: fibronectin type III domain-containing protein [Eubacterium sp.]|nr:fibronectin type III domain-containing protein [Eubacterium sp.]